MDRVDNWQAARAARISARLDRIEDYTWLEQTGITTAREAAQRLGVSMRTIVRYRRHLREHLEPGGADTL